MDKKNGMILMKKEAPMESLEEEVILIERAKENPEAFRPLYDKYYVQIFRFIFKKIEEEEVAADLTSAVFLKALLKLKSYRHQGFSFGAWLFKIALNEMLLYFREHKKQRNVMIGQDFLDSLQTSGNKEKEILLDRLTNAIQDLKEKEVQLIELKFWEKKSYKEIAFIMEISLPNVKVKMHRLYRKLENKIKNNSL